MQNCQKCGNEIESNKCPHCGHSQSVIKSNIKTKSIQKVNIKIDLPTVSEAIRIAKQKINSARTKGVGVLKLVHGYGSSGKGGKIRIELREELLKMKSRRMISDVIFGEDFSRNKCKQLLRRFPELKDEEDFNHNNKGVTLVEL